MVKVSVSRCSVAGDAKWGVLLPNDCQCFELIESGKGASFLYIRFAFATIGGTCVARFHNLASLVVLA
jgi:hypothetical protein